MKKVIALLSSALLLVGANMASAAIIAQYQVSDAVATHGLWTHGQQYNGDNSFNLQGDVLLTQFDDGTASLTGTAADSGVSWDINISFGDYNVGTPDVTGAKEGGGPALASWEYYYSFVGTLTNNLGDVVNVSRVGPAMQIGIGANDKNGAFGASAWMRPDLNDDRHWDLNMNLTAVPAPAALALFGLGLLVLGAKRKRA